MAQDFTLVSQSDPRYTSKFEASKREKILTSRLSALYNLYQPAEWGSESRDWLTKIASRASFDADNTFFIITIITLKTYWYHIHRHWYVHVSILCGGNLKQCISLHMLLHHRGLVLCSLRSESISAKLFAPGHHHGKGVKAVCRPSSNTIGLPTSATNRASNTKANIHQISHVESTLWPPRINLPRHNLGLKYLERVFLWGESERTLYSIYICGIEKDPAWRLDLNPGNWFSFINHAFCIAPRPVWGLMLPMMQPPSWRGPTRIREKFTQNLELLQRFLEN